MWTFCGSKELFSRLGQGESVWCRWRRLYWVLFWVFFLKAGVMCIVYFLRCGKISPSIVYLRLFISCTRNIFSFSMILWNKKQNFLFWDLELLISQTAVSFALLFGEEGFEFFLDHYLGLIRILMACVSSKHAKIQTIGQNCPQNCEYTQN